MSDSPLSPLDFVGTWTVRRTVVDHRAAATYLFEGTGIVTRTLFEETGQIRIGKTSLSSGRAYRLDMDEKSVSIQRLDGSDFVRLKRMPSQIVHHLCGRDTYTGRFFFPDADSWVETWRVHGPQKNYASLSRYSRVAKSS